MELFKAVYILILILDGDGVLTRSIRTDLEKWTDRDLADLLDMLSKRQNCQRIVKYRSVYVRGNVYTVDVNDPGWEKNPQEAIVIDDGVISYVGSNCGTEWYIWEDPCVDEVAVFDLKEATVLPGIHDVHMHPLEARSPVCGVCILPSSTGPDTEEMRLVLEECPVKQKGTAWILGHGHSITDMLEHIENGGRSPKAILDHFIPEDPAVMMEETSHSVWANSKALELAGIDSNTPTRPGGVIMREKGSNEPNGILLENEGIAIMSLALAPNTDLDELNFKGLLEALKELRANGITSVCDARLFWKRQHQKAWDKACNEGELTVRAVLGLWAYPLENDDVQISTLKGLYSNGETHCSLKKSQIKLYSDGLLQSTTAAMLDPYEKNLELPEMGTKNIGMNYFDQNRIEKYIRALQNFDNDKGFDFNIHAIGDRGINEALNAIENTYNPSAQRYPRHRLTHVEIVNPYDIDRFKQLDVIADFQVAGDFTLLDGHKSVEKLIGKDKADFYIPVKSVVETEAIATLSSDWDVSDLNPFVGIQHATERGNQSVSVKIAIEMYTVNPAFAMRQENEVGSLVAGKIVIE